MKTSTTVFLAATWAVTTSHPWPRNESEGLNLTEACINREKWEIETSTAEAAFSSSFHFSVAFAGSLLLLFGWVYVCRGGYVLSRRKSYSTDDHMWFWMGLISIPWTVLVPVSTIRWDKCESRYEIEPYGSWLGYRFWGRMAFVPWILDAVFLWWAMERFMFRKIRPEFKSILGKEFCVGKKLARYFNKRHRWELWICFTFASVPTVWAAIGALQTMLYLLGTLAFGGLAMFLAVLYASYQYANFDTGSPHTYAMDDIRVPTLSAGQTGLAYILPTPSAEANNGHVDPLSPVIGYSLQCEQKLLWNHRSFLEPAYRDTQWDLNTPRAQEYEDSLRKCTNSVKELITSLIGNIPDDESMIQALGVWLYNMQGGETADNTPSLPPTPDSRLRVRNAAGLSRPMKTYTLIGRDIALALLVWEELVFDRRWQLVCHPAHRGKECPTCDTFRHKAWELREKTGTLALGRTTVRGSTAGLASADGLAGLHAATKEVYRLIPIMKSSGDVDLGLNAMNDAIGTVPEVQKTAGDLWNVCWKVYPSTFGAFYLWTTAWYMYYGNNGLHTMPLLPEKDLGLWLDHIPSYLTPWRIRWRFLWYGSVACQLVIMLPTALVALIGLIA